MSRKLTTQEFIHKAKLIHGDKFGYDLTDYRGQAYKIKIICPIHGVFEQNANSHLRGRGCPKCKTEKAGNRTRLNTKGFIKKAKDVHGDKYDYSKVSYKDMNTKVCIICPIHGEFWQTPDTHLRGSGCMDCGYDKLRISNAMNLKEFIAKATTLHQGIYDYSKVKYKNCMSSVCIICAKHGEFYQRPDVHLKGCGCPKCRSERLSIEKSYTLKNFIDKAKAIHGNKYGYEQVDYKGCGTPVKIWCDKHGFFWQKPRDHLQGCGCPHCAKSVGEDAISEWLEYNKIEYKSQHWIEPNQVLFGARRLRVDFYLPSIKTIIEFNGRQHYERVAAWQTEEEFQEQKDRDRRLREFCKQKGIMLTEIPYTEIKNINAILRSRVTATLG